MVERVDLNALVGNVGASLLATARCREQARSHEKRGEDNAFHLEGRFSSFELLAKRGELGAQLGHFAAQAVDLGLEPGDTVLVGGRLGRGRFG